MMLLAEFALAIDYGQIFVFRPSPASPVVAWTDEHVAQGFAWSPSAVSFGVPYSLVFEALPGEVATDHDYPFVFKLTFCADPYPDFEILKQGAELTTNQVLRKDS